MGYSQANTDLVKELINSRDITQLTKRIKNRITILYIYKLNCWKEIHDLSRYVLASKYVNARGFFSDLLCETIHEPNKAFLRRRTGVPATAETCSLWSGWLHWSSSVVLSLHGGYQPGRPKSVSRATPPIVVKTCRYFLKFDSRSRNSLFLWNS